MYPPDVREVWRTGRLWGGGRRVESIIIVLVAMEPKRRGVLQMPYVDAADRSDSERGGEYGGRSMRTGVGGV